VGLPARAKEELAKVEEIYNLLLDNGFDVLYDDRKATPDSSSPMPIFWACLARNRWQELFPDGHIEVKPRSSY
jgi:hypothetical protein